MSEVLPRKATDGGSLARSPLVDGGPPSSSAAVVPALAPVAETGASAPAGSRSAARRGDSTIGSALGSRGVVSDVAVLIALVRLIAVVACAIGLAETVAGIIVREPRAAVLGLTAVT